VTEQNKDPLELYIYKKTGGKYDPRMAKLFIDCLKEWLPYAVRSSDSYYQGWNAYKAEVIENLKWNPNEK